MSIYGDVRSSHESDSSSDRQIPVRCIARPRNSNVFALCPKFLLDHLGIGRFPICVQKTCERKIFSHESIRKIFVRRVFYLVGLVGLIGRSSGPPLEVSPPRFERCRFMPRTMPRKNFPIVSIGSKKFSVSQRGLIDSEPKPIDRPPEQSEVMQAMAALQNCRRSTHPTVLLSDVSLAIRRRYGYISPGALLVALHRLRIDARSLSRSEIYVGIDAGWIEDQRRLDRSFIPTIKRTPISKTERDQYSHPSRRGSIAPELGRGAREVFWFDVWEVAS